MSKVESPFIVRRTIGTKRLFSRGVFFTMIGEAQNGMVQNVLIGRYCSIAQHVDVGYGEYPLDLASAAKCFYVPGFAGYGRYLDGCVAAHKCNCFRNTEIGNDIWIGEHAIVKAGVRIGEGAVVAVCAFVDNDVPPYAIVGGVPAKVIRYRFDAATINELLELKWWNYDLADFGELDWSDVKGCIARIREGIAKGIKPYAPKPVASSDLCNAERFL